MSGKHKHRQHSYPAAQYMFADGDVHVAAFGTVVDLAAWKLSVETVAKADREWLRKHRNAPYRRRPIAPVEMKMTGYGKDTEVIVSRGPHGSQQREFYPVTT